MTDYVDDEQPNIKMYTAQHDKPGPNLHHCANCDKYYEYTDTSMIDRSHCRFCLPHCAICLTEKHLNEFYDLDFLDVLCIGCLQRVMRTCEKCNKEFRDWKQEEADRCEECEDLTDDEESD